MSTKERRLWISIRTRKAGIDPRFEDLRYFSDWCNNQIGWERHGGTGNGKDNRICYHLDKDILSDGINRIYSPDTCVFVPAEINCLVTSQPKKRELPTGITRYGGSHSHYRYVLHMSIGMHQHYEVFLNLDDAYNMYCKLRGNRILEVSGKWESHIDHRVHEKLNLWGNAWLNHPDGWINPWDCS